MDVSRQALDRSAPGLDEVLFQDLIADYNMRLDLQILTGSGSGAIAKASLSDANRIVETWTQGTPTVALFNNQVASAKSQIAAQTFRAPTHILSIRGAGHGSARRPTRPAVRCSCLRVTRTTRSVPGTNDG